jgi:hypothetical protein
MSAATTNWRERVEEFFYHEEVPYGQALVRMGMPIVMLFMVVPRWPVARELFSADGAPSQVSVGYGYGSLFPELPGSLAVALMSLLVFTSVTSAIGWRTRPSLIVTFLLYTYFCWMDAISTTTKYTSIASHAFLLLAVSPCGAVWSVDAWLANDRRAKWPAATAVERPKHPVWSRRLMQFLMGLIYFGAAVTKMQTPGFFSGDQLQAWMLTHINYRHPVGEYLSLYPVLLVAFSYIAIVWELLFVFLVWNKGFWRTAILALGVCFHFMTSLTLGLLIFPATCYTLYLAFVDEEDVQQAAAWFRRVCRRFRALNAVVRAWSGRLSQGNGTRWAGISWPAFLAAAALVMVGGAAIEYQMDPYGQRRPEGPYSLVPVDPDLLETMLAPTPQLRDVDKFFAIDTGTILVGDLLANRRTTFRQGERLIAQCHLNVPHEDMWIEMHLYDSDNHLMARDPKIATREMYRAHFHYDVCTCTPPGEYSLAILTAGREVLRKPITILPGGGASCGQ